MRWIRASTSPSVLTQRSTYERFSPITRVYIGGDFTTVGGVARQRLAALDVNGVLDTAWKPRTSTWVKSLAFSCDGSKVIAGAASARRREAARRSSRGRPSRGSTP